MATPPTLMPLSPAAPAAPAAAPEPCGLESLIRPNFFAGQLLSDQDLAALLTWVKRHRGLQRYRGGWGVVCGLDVTPDGSKPGQVVVGPGYAVGPCGGDILVPEATSHDFADVCQGSNPCAGTAAGPPLDDVDFGGIKVPGQDVRVVQLSLKGKPSPMQPQPALGRPPTGPNGTACDYARIKECFEVVHTALDLGAIQKPPTPVTQPPSAAGVLDAFKVAFGDLYASNLSLPPAPPDPKAPDPKAVRAWFQTRLAKPASAPRRFPAVSAMLDALTDDEVVTKWKLVPLLFWMLLDERLAAQVRPCATTTADCVPLARVWLWHQAAGCVVMRIDLDPPYRRPLGPDNPAPPLLGDLPSLFWVPWEGARDALLAQGAKAPGQEKLSLSATPEALASLLAGSDQVVQVVPQDTVVVQTWADNIITKPKVVDRVVGFTKTAAPRKALGAKVTKVEWLADDTTNFPNAPLPSPFPTGSKGVARVTVNNSGEADLTFTPLLHAGGALVLKGTDQAVVAGQTQTWATGTFTLPDKAPADGRLRLTVCGTAADSRSLVAQAADDKSDAVQIHDALADFTATPQLAQGAQVVPAVLPGLQVMTSLSIPTAAKVALTFDLTAAMPAKFTLQSNQSQVVRVAVPASATGSDWTLQPQGKVRDVFGRRVKGPVSGDAATDLLPPQKLPLLPVPVELKIDGGGAFAVNTSQKYDLKLTNNANDPLTIQALTVTPRGGSLPLTLSPAVTVSGVQVDKAKSQTFQFDFNYVPAGEGDNGPPVFVVEARLVLSGNRADVRGACTL